LIVVERHYDYEYDRARLAGTRASMRRSITRSGTMCNPLPDILQEFRRHKKLADSAMVELADDEFFQRPGAQVNPIALIVKHLAGNLASRWTDFLGSDGEKPTRDRDSEFVLGENDTRASLLEAWERGWKALFDTLAQLGEHDLGRTVTIRGEPHTASQAALRGLTHAAYHIGQILYVARLLRPDRRWLTIRPGESRGDHGGYLRKT
jgi:Protein of unknown function (DUF1572)